MTVLSSEADSKSGSPIPVPQLRALVLYIFSQSTFEGLTFPRLMWFEMRRCDCTFGLITDAARIVATMPNCQSVDVAALERG